MNELLIKAANMRHAVRRYTSDAIDNDTKSALLKIVDECNQKSGLHIQAVFDEPQAFGSKIASYGKFFGVRNYLALIGKKDSLLNQRLGYYGENIVLEAQLMGLNSCWVAATYKKINSAFCINSGEKLVAVIALGYGETQGKPHIGKTPQQVSSTYDVAPDWFKRGVDCALLAPTALNQQKFTFELENDLITATPGLGFYTQLDLGIAKFHFELGAEQEGLFCL